ncbi:MAG: 3-hydroxyacyl-ACP dehydratase FabZ [Alphaproteobacteria bacterium]|nr:3-hydroxyacyl-ACP dehydratase FabZ [Alphaproteobacteria bacterium]
MTTINALKPAVADIDTVELMTLLPHRHPFLLIDRLVDVVPGESATGIKAVTIGEHYFVGHFPNRPIMPGVLIVEAMAQTAGALVVKSMGGPPRNKLVYFMSVENAKFRRPVFPGALLRVPVVKERQRGNVWKFAGKALVDDELMAEATFTAMIVDA